MEAIEMRNGYSTKYAHETVISGGYGSRSRQSKPRLERYLNSFSTIAFATIMLASWEGMSGSMAAGLFNGGPSVLVYGLILATFGALAVASSLAELASILPIAGAQYHWTYALAPFAPRFFSFILGWITVFAWISTIAIIPFLTGTEIQGVIMLYHPTYQPETWHSTLIMWAVMIVPLAVNVFTRRLLPSIEVLGGTLHMLAFPAIIITLIMLAPRNQNEFVWETPITGLAGWTNPGVVWSIGMLTVVSTMNGYDGVIHMAEEVKNSKKVVPRAMVLGVFINAVLNFGFVVTVLYTMGGLLQALTTPTGVPIVNIYYRATQSLRATTTMLVFAGLPGFVALFNSLASVTRLTWSFARDEGLPFSNFFVKISPQLKIPFRCLCLVSTSVVLITVINIGSTTAFNAIMSLSALALYFSYLVPIVFLAIKRFTAPEDLPWGPFYLGRWGLPINLFAIAWMVYVIVFLPFPSQLPVTKENMNYAAPVFVGVVFFAMVDWVVRGHRVWRGPALKVASE